MLYLYAVWLLVARCWFCVGVVSCYVWRDCCDSALMTVTRRDPHPVYGSGLDVVCSFA